MPDAITTLPVSRRSLLGGILPGAAALAVPAGAAVALPALPCLDLPLIQADCRVELADLAYDGLFRRYSAAEEDPPEPELVAIESEWGEAIKLLVSRPALTMAGLSAKARAILRVTDPDRREALAVSLAEDVLAIGRLGPAAV